MLMDKQDGSVLVLSMVFMLVLTVLAAGMAVTINNEIHISSYEENMIQADYYTESAVEYASYLLSDDSKWDDNELIEETKAKIENLLNGLNIEKLSRNISGDEYLLTISGEYNRVNTKLLVIYKLVSDLFNIKLFEFPIAAGKEIHPNETIKVEGELAANSNITGIENIYDYDANLKDADDIQANLGDGDEELKTDVLIDYFTEAKEKADYVIESFGTYQDSSGEHLIYIDGEGKYVLDIANRIVVVKGNITLDKDLYIKGSGVLIVRGDLSFNSNYKLYANYENSTYTDEYAISYIENNVNVHCGGRYKGLLVSKSDLSINTNNFELIGSAFAINNANLKGAYRYDNGYIDVLNSIAMSRNFASVNITRKINDWQEF